MLGRRQSLMVTMLIALTVTPWATASVTDPSSTVDGLQGEEGERTITYVGSVRDRTDMATLGLGSAGWWFPQFGAQAVVPEAPTGDNARDELPDWVAAFNHTTSPLEPGCTEPGALERGCTPTYNFRTFSQDGPARSASNADWSELRLPSAECGRSGAVFDPHTFVADQEYDDPTGIVSPRDGEEKPNTNNTINRIQLQDGVPASFHVAVLVDNTAREHDPGVVEVRGNVGLLDVPSQVADSQVESTIEKPVDLSANGIPDLHVFRIDGFVTGDYLKLRLRGSTSAAAFGGLLFDLEVDPAVFLEADTSDDSAGPGSPRGKRNEHDRGQGKGHEHHDHAGPPGEERPPPGCAEPV